MRIVRGTHKVSSLEDNVRSHASHTMRAAREAFFRRRIYFFSLGNIRLGYATSIRAIRVETQIWAYVE